MGFEQHFFAIFWGTHAELAPFFSGVRVKLKIFGGNFYLRGDQNGGG